MNDLTDLYREIRKDAHPVSVELNGRTYATIDTKPVLDPTPSCLEVRTLTGLVDFLKTNVDKLPVETLLCHVENPRQVTVRSAVHGAFAQRSTHICAKMKMDPFPFEEFLNAERFNIKLQACFADTPVTVDGELKATDRALMLRYIGNMRESVVKATGDDGTTQEVTVKVGIATVADVALPNPVILRPYRTFNEVEQPASAFVFRAQEGPRFALFEADNGAWESEAMKSIKAFLEFEVPGLHVIA